MYSCQLATRDCLICKSLESKKIISQSPIGNTILSSLKTAIEKIKTPEAEKKNLLFEIEGLKEIAETKAVTLESEVGLLRDGVKSVKILISGSEPSA